MPVVWIPPLMRDLIGGQAQVSVPGRTVDEVVAALDESYAGIRDRLCEGDRLKRGIAVSVDGRVARQELSALVGEESEVRFLPALGGG